MIEKIYYEGKIINKVGIDRIVLNQVVLKKINYEVFTAAMAKCAIRYDDTLADGRQHYTTENGDEFCYLKIEDNELGTFTFGVKHKQYGIYQFSPKEMWAGVNLVNFTAKELHSFIDDVEGEMKSKYGLEIEFGVAKIREIELNTTVALAHKFSMYRRVLTVMMSIMPYLKKDDTNGENNKKAEEKLINGQTVYNKQVSMSVYNKSREMELAIKDAGMMMIYDDDGVIVDNDLMRIEGKLKTPVAVSKKFHGKNELKDLTDEKVCEVFEEIVRCYFSEPYRCWKENNRKKLRKVVRNELKNERNWKMAVLEDLRNTEQLTGIPVLLGMEDLRDILKEFPDPSRHVGRRMCGFKLRKNDVFLEHDDQKYIEILDNLECAIRNTKALL